MTDRAKQRPLKCILAFLVPILIAALIAVTHRRFKVWEDPRIDAVVDLLPGTNCGACGQAGCRAFAEAIVGGSIQPATAPAFRSSLPALPAVGEVGSWVVAPKPSRPGRRVSFGRGAGALPGSPFCWALRFRPTPSKMLKAMKMSTKMSPE